MYYWLPEKSVDGFSDSISVYGRVLFVKSMFRQESMYRFRAIRSRIIGERGSRCEVCGDLENNLHVHHIKPIWAFILEMICEEILSRSENDGFSSTVDDELESCIHADENLLLVCKNCHTSVEKETDKKMAEYYEGKYPCLCVNLPTAINRAKRYKRQFR